MADTSAREEVTRSLRRLFVTAALLVITSVVLGSILLGNVTLKFGRATDDVERWSDRIAGDATLNAGLQALSEPAQNIFVSRNADIERQHLIATAGAFRTAVAEHRANLLGKDAAEGRALAPLRGRFDQLDHTIRTIETGANAVLESYGEGRSDDATRLLAAANRTIGIAHAELDDITAWSLNAQQQVVEQERASAARTRQLALPLGLGALLAVAAVSMLSRLTGQRLQGIAKEREALLDSLERSATELNAYNRKLSESNRDLTDFAYVASHDLQEPLRKIIAFGDRLQSRRGEELGDDGRDYLNRMQNAAGRMQTLIQDLLTFSRVTTRGEPFVRSDLNVVVSGVVSDLEVAIERAEATVNVGHLPTIDVDPSQFRQLTQNLIGNALKFRRDGAPAYVSLKATRLSTTESESLDAIYPDADGWWRFEVRDNGIGFEQKYADKIFTVFQRLHGRSEYDGSGVGLAVCRRIVERHRGEIHATGTAGTGATFSFAIPSHQASDNVHDVGTELARDEPATSDRSLVGAAS